MPKRHRYKLTTLLVFALLYTCGSARADTLPAPAAARASPEQMLFDSDPTNWAKPTRVIPPKYPSSALDKNITGYVDIDVLIGMSGYMAELRSISSTPKNEDFEDAVREVLKKWQFSVPISQECKPYETVGNVRVWFEIKNGEGVISVSRPADVEKAATPAPSRPVYKAKNLRAVNSTLRFPSGARRDRAQGVVYVVVIVDPANGKAIGSEVSYAFSTVRQYEAKFAEAVRTVAARYEFPPLLAQTEPVRVCLPVIFTITD